MLNNIADRRAEKNFHFIMQAIKDKSIRKAEKAKAKEKAKESYRNS